MKKNLIIFLLIITVLAGFASLKAQNFYSSAPSFFSDQRAVQVGDIVTVLIVEYSSAKSQAGSSNKKKTDRGIGMKAGTGVNANTPLFNVSADFDNGFDNDASTTRRGSLTGKITATITEVNQAGNLVINGVRDVVVNGEHEKITVTGVVRPSDISTNNTVYSYNISDAQITYQGKGMVEKGQKPGMFTRFLGWLF